MYQNDNPRLRYDNRHPMTQAVLDYLTSFHFGAKIRVQTQIGDEVQGIVPVSRTCYAADLLTTTIAIHFGQPSGYSSIKVWGEISRTIGSKSINEFASTFKQPIFRTFRNPKMAARYIYELLTSA